MNIDVSGFDNIYYKDEPSIKLSAELMYTIVSECIKDRNRDENYYQECIDSYISYYTENPPNRSDGTSVIFNTKIFDKQRNLYAASIDQERRLAENVVSAVECVYCKNTKNVRTIIEQDRGGDEGSTVKVLCKNVGCPKYNRPYKYEQ